MPAEREQIRAVGMQHHTDTEGMQASSAEQEGSCSLTGIQLFGS